MGHCHDCGCPTETVYPLCLDCGRKDAAELDAQQEAADRWDAEHNDDNTDEGEDDDAET